MHLVKIYSGQAYLVTPQGAIIRSVSRSGATSCDVNNRRAYVVVSFSDGNVELYDFNGALIRVLSKGAKSVIFSGDDVAITLNNGSTELRTIDGALIRML